MPVLVSCLMSHTKQSRSVREVSAATSWTDGVTCSEKVFLFLQLSGVAQLYSVVGNIKKLIKFFCCCKNRCGLAETYTDTLTHSHTLSVFQVNVATQCDPMEVIVLTDSE